jgi:hypothetical protein
MTAGRLGKEQRAKARVLFFVFISIDRGVMTGASANP